MHKASTFGYLAQSIRGSLKSIGKSDKNYLLLAALVGVLEHAHAKLAQTQHVGHANGQEHALDGRDTEMQLSVAFSSAKQLTEFQNYLAEHAKLLDGLLIPDGIQFSAIEPGSAELPSHDANIFYTINPDGSVALMGDGALQTIAANMDEVELYAQTSVQTVTDAGAGSGLPSATYIASSSLPLGVIAGGLGALGLAAASSGSGGGTQAESVNPSAPANQAPTALALSASTVAENAAGAIIGTLTTTDPDSADTHTYTVNDARFEVVGSKLKLKDGTSLDYEAASTVSLSVTATDAGGLSKAQVFAIAVTDVADTPVTSTNNAPTALALSASTVAENAAGAIIGTLTTTDPDSADTHTYTVNDARFEVVGGKLKLKDGTSLDYEAASTVSLSVTATDAGGLSKAQVFAIAVTDVADTPVTSTNNAPTALALSASTVAENAAGAIIGTLTTTDPDSADTHTYTVNDARFEVVGGKLKLKDGTSLDYEAASTVSLSVTATDAGGLSKTQVFAIAVTDVADTPVTSTNNAPTALALSASTVAENAAGAIIGALTTTDPDSADTHTYTVNDARFEVVGGKLKLKDGTSLDYEAASTVSLSVTATDAGGLSKTQVFAIAVTDAAETTTKIGTAGNDTFNHAGGLDDFIISGLAGADSIATSNGNDIIRLGEGADTVQAGAGNDIVVVVGQTSASQYTQADIDNPGGSGINLSSVITLADLNGRTVSEVQPGESIDGGTGTNRLVIYGNVDLTGVALTNITQFQVNSTVTLTAQQLNALPVTLMFGDGESNLNITNPGGTPVVVDLSGISLSDFRSLNLAAGVTLVVDQADVSSLLYLAGAGTLKASPATGTLNLAGKYTTLTVQDKDAVVDVTHGGASFVSGALIIASEAGETLTGGSNDDRLLGGDSNDILNGGGGNDILRGGKGVDEMHGGTGDDRFVIVGDLSGGGKIDSTADTDVLGFPLTTLNGKTFGEDVGGGTIRGGEGDDTLYVFGTADLSAWDIEGIEHIEMRSDVKFTKTFFEKNVIKTVSGDGRSTLRIVSDTPITLDLAALDAFKLSGIGSVELGSNVTLKVTSLDQLGGAKILTGAGKIEAKTGSLSLSGYTKTTGLKVKNADGSDTTGGEVLENAILRGKDGVYLGTNGDDYMKGTAVKDTFISGNGADVMLGDAGDDTYIIDGSGKKIVLDTAGADTLDLSKLTTGAKIDLINGGTAGATSIELGSGAGRAPIDLMILQDLSGSFNEDVPIVTALLDNLFAGVKAIHSDSRFGASAFVDKPVSPFGETGDYVYKTWQTITNDTGAVKTAFSNMQVLSGNDGPESQLESLYQVALRTIADDATATTTGDEIGYRSGSMRVVVLTTDADYHLAGDHAGVGPNDGDTVLDGTPQGTGEDYPTVAKVKEALVKANIYPIFAVTNGVEGTYEELVTQLGRGDVVSLSSDSSNLISSIQTGLTNFKQDFIENLVGTNFSDELTGNSLDNRIEGGKGDDLIKGMGGNDTLIGGDGSDTAVFRGNKADYSFDVMSKVGDAAWLRVSDGDSGRDGADIVSYTIEKMKFEGNGEAVDIADFLKTLDPVKSAEDIFKDYAPSGSFSENWFKFFFDLSKASYFHTNTHKEMGAGSKDHIFIENKSSLSALNSNQVRTESDAYSYLVQSDIGYEQLKEFDTESKRTSTFKNSGGQTFTFDYQIKDGWYIASSNKIPGLDTRSSVAMLGASEDGKSLFVTFRGTDVTVDWVDDLYDMYGHYDRYQPLFSLLKDYINNPDSRVENVYVSGHSLGGQMATWFMADNKGDDRFSAVLFESANKGRLIDPVKGWGYSHPAFDDRIVSFETENDPVPDLGGFSVAGLPNNPGKVIHLNVSGYPLPATLHGMGAMQLPFMQSISYIDKDALPTVQRIYSQYGNELSTDGGLGKTFLDLAMSVVLGKVSLFAAKAEVTANAIENTGVALSGFSFYVAEITSLVLDKIAANPGGFLMAYIKGPVAFMNYMKGLIAKSDVYNIQKDVLATVAEHANVNIFGETAPMLNAAFGYFTETYLEMIQTGYNILVADSGIVAAASSGYLTEADKYNNAKLAIEQIPFYSLITGNNLAYKHTQSDITHVEIKPFVVSEDVFKYFKPLEATSKVLTGIDTLFKKFLPTPYKVLLTAVGELSFISTTAGKLLDQKISIDASDWAGKSGAKLIIEGSYDSNKILGSIMNDVIDGRWGDDIIFGNAGNDILVGSGDADVLVGGAGNDLLVSYTVNGSGLTVKATDEDFIKYLFRDEFGFGNDVFEELSENYSITERIDAKEYGVMYGGEGSDTMIGINGPASLNPFSKRGDAFFVDSKSAGHDTIYNFDFKAAGLTHGVLVEDKIVLSANQLGVSTNLLTNNKNESYEIFSGFHGYKINSDLLEVKTEINFDALVLDKDTSFLVDVWKDQNWASLYFVADGKVIDKLAEIRLSEYTSDARNFYAPVIGSPFDDDNLIIVDNFDPLNGLVLV